MNGAIFPLFQYAFMVWYSFNSGLIIVSEAIAVKFPLVLYKTRHGMHRAHAEVVELSVYLL
jgi:hypothetical protein